MNLFNRTETIIRTTSTGYINEDEEYVAGGTTNITIQCNIQPYREGVNAFNSPTGYRTTDALEIYSCEPLVASSEIDNIVGDQITINGKEYYCKDLEAWNQQTYNAERLIPIYYLGYFYRKDKS